MTNDFSEISAESEFRDDMTIDPRENDEYVGWPGDGSGEDDLADYNQNEADDYRNEGESDYEQDTPMGQEYGDGFDND